MLKLSTPLCPTARDTQVSYIPQTLISTFSLIFLFSVAVAEFVDAVGIAIVPPALMEDLKLDEGEVAQFCRIEMPIATKVFFELSF